MPASTYSSTGAAPIRQRPAWNWQEADPGHALQPASTATSLRRQGSGGFAVTDGAFVETKEAIGGYYVVEAADLDEAMAVAKGIPAPFGGVEIRPVREFS